MVRPPDHRPERAPLPGGHGNWRTRIGLGGTLIVVAVLAPGAACRAFAAAPAPQSVPDPAPQVAPEPAPQVALEPAEEALSDEEPADEAPAEGESVDESPAPWRRVHGWLSGERDRMSDDLERAHEILLQRAESEAPELLPRISPDPPSPRATGWGLLPTLKADSPRSTPPLRERRYGLEFISTAYTKDMRDADVLAQTVDAEPDAPLEPLVTDFERLRKRLRNLEEHLDYHEFWQGSVVDSPEFFAERNAIVVQVRELVALRKAVAADESRRAELEDLEAAVRTAVSPFRPVTDLEIELSDDARSVLPMKVVTDIEDETFLAEFRGAVESEFNASDAARAAKFEIALTIEVVPPATLFPEGVPEVGATVDLDEHRARFGEGAVVLTTGAASTHAWQGRALLLGTAPVSRRTLAHEFGHLLGFGDAYLRGFDGDPDGRYGAVLVEWSGLVDDLMGNTKGGRVTEAMIAELLVAYGSES